MNKTEKIYLLAFLIMGLMTILFMNIPSRNVDVVKSDSSITLFPETETIKKAVIQSFETGKVASLNAYFTKEITLTVEDTEFESSAEKTVVSLNSFFKDNPPKSFYIKHEGSNKIKTEKFWIGEYTSLDNIVFSVYIYSEKGKIYSIEIASEELTS